MLDHEDELCLAARNGWIFFEGVRGEIRIWLGTGRAHLAAQAGDDTDGVVCVVVQFSVIMDVGNGRTVGAELLDIHRHNCSTLVLENRHCLSCLQMHRKFKISARVRGVAGVH